MITTSIDKSSFLYNFLKAICLIIFKIFYHIEVEGDINLPEDKGYIICSNHLHLFDPVLIACFTKRQLSFMGKKELFDIPILKWVLRKVSAFPVDRGNSDIAALKTAINILTSNNVMAMFPEGTRSKTGELGEFKGGAALIAYKADVPIVPVKIIGKYRIFSKITLKIGNPILPDKGNRKELKNILYERIKKM